ncbi:2Fe-2S iron-sulfur cluster-binding protein [Massilia sp. S19_KUP03_FR1]|uniref:2Fe-2S iron-sulfur cluster-binding protein n=1 Tax=Massilia sp. S19_KUP03_FR1 TaxID=3025503 RepID=UPI002FCDD816
MTFQITFSPSGLTCAGDGARSVLHSAEAGGITLPSSCRNGTCRTCLCRMQSGSVRYLVDWPGLSLDEKRDGDILTCVAVPLSDLVLAAPHARRAG